LTKLVFSYSQVNFPSGGDCGANGSNDACNIGRLSHYDIFGSTDGGVPPTGGTVPETASTALLGLGLLGFTASRRKSAKSKNVKAVQLHRRSPLERTFFASMPVVLDG
jgi:hypothetical protein